MLAWLDHPELAAPQRVLVAGTNGKGSVASTLSAIATQAGRRTGLFTSPHLIRVHERFRIDDQDIDNETFDRYGDRVLAAIEESQIPLSFFEAMVTLAVLWFRDEGVEVQILEAGLGGARDGTRPATPTHAVITGVAMDHIKTLGPTLEHIAREKLDICEPGAKSVIHLPPSLQHLAPPAWQLGKEVRFRRTQAGMRLWTPEGRFDLPQPALLGPHQRRNAAIAAATALRMGFDAETIGAGLQAVRWPARMQQIPGDPPTWIDGAHNPDAIRALLKTMEEIGIADGFTLVFGAHPRKNTGRLLRRLAARAGSVVLTTAERLETVDELRAQLPDRRDVRTDPNCGRALQTARLLGKPVVVAGSLYLAGAVLGWLETQ